SAQIREILISESAWEEMTCLFAPSLADENFHVGLGYTAGVTARDNWNYIPIPVLLPLASIGYGPATFQMTYIPGTYNNGNVYFAWMRFQF
ncbi:hypothetical protein V6266_12045, partial [Enterobacter asburiae]